MKNNKLLLSIIVLASVLWTVSLFANNFTNINKEISSTIKKSVTDKIEYTDKELIDLLVNAGIKENREASFKAPVDLEMYNIYRLYISQRPQESQDDILFTAISRLLLIEEATQSAFYLYSRENLSSLLSKQHRVSLLSGLMMTHRYKKGGNFLTEVKTILGPITGTDIIHYFNAPYLEKDFSHDVFKGGICPKELGMEELLLDAMDLIAKKCEDSRLYPHKCIKMKPGSSEDILMDWVKQYIKNPNDKKYECDTYLEYVRRLTKYWDSYAPDAKIQGMIQESNPPRRIRKIFKL